MKILAAWCCGVNGSVDLMQSVVNLWLLFLILPRLCMSKLVSLSETFRVFVASSQSRCVVTERRKSTSRFAMDLTLLSHEGNSTSWLSVSTKFHLVSMISTTLTLLTVSDQGPVWSAAKPALSHGRHLPEAEQRLLAFFADIFPLARHLSILDMTLYFKPIRGIQDRRLPSFTPM